MKKLYAVLLFASTITFAQGSLCTDPIVISSLPYSTSDDTANYGDNYDPQTTTHPVCGSSNYGNYYHGGNDVIYSYTPQANGVINLEMPNVVGWTAMFIYTDCANIGVQYAACATGVSAGTRTISNFAVTAGQTYFIYISSWPAPQTFTYTLNVTEAILATAEAQQNRDVVLYPNPVSDVLSVRTESEIKNAVIYTLNGQRINANISAAKEIRTENLPQGFYILELTTADGMVFRKDFIKS